MTAPVLDPLHYGRHSAGLAKPECLETRPGRHSMADDVAYHGQTAEQILARQLRTAVLESAAARESAPSAPKPRGWNEDAPTVTVSAYRPDRKHLPPDPVNDDTVGIMPVGRHGGWRVVSNEDAAVAALRSRPGWPQEPLPGDPHFRYDEPPIGHNTGAHPLDMTRVGDFKPIETRVKKTPWYQQIWYGLFPKKVKL